MTDFVNPDDLITIDPQIKERWVNDLRSGNFSQVKGKLHTDEGYCCLGVLCNQALDFGILEEGSVEVPDYNMVKYSYRAVNSDEYPGFVSLPNSVIDWAGMKDASDLSSAFGKLPFTGREGNRVYLDDCNDEGMPFDQIADLIEFWY